MLLIADVCCVQYLYAKSQNNKERTVLKKKKNSIPLNIFLIDKLTDFPLSDFYFLNIVITKILPGFVIKTYNFVNLYKLKIQF